MKSNPPAWQSLYEFVNGGGIESPGLRDPDNPCESFEVEGLRTIECSGDGHYLCRRCVHKSES